MLAGVGEVGKAEYKDGLLLCLYLGCRNVSTRFCSEESRLGLELTMRL